MLEYSIMLELPLRDKETKKSPVYIPVVKYDFDPGLQVGQIFTVVDLKLGEQTFTFPATVGKIMKRVVCTPEPVYQIIASIQSLDVAIWPEIAASIGALIDVDNLEFDEGLYIHIDYQELKNTLSRSNVLEGMSELIGLR
jgi:hypothetical protein